MLVKEISLKNGNVQFWDSVRIKNAFNFGKGSKKDMINYIKNNKKYAKFEILEK